MADLANLDSLSGDDLTEEQIRGMIRKIDLNIANLMNDGKLGAARIAENYAGGQSVDRAAALDAMLKARAAYQRILDDIPVIVMSQFDDPYDSNGIP
jgi:hypothetical protein